MRPPGAGDRSTVLEWHRQPLADPDELVGLETELPLRVREAVLERELGVAGEVRPVHRLEVELSKVVCFEAVRLSIRLRIDELQFAPVSQDRLRAGLRADADPVDARGR